MAYLLVSVSVKESSPVANKVWKEVEAEVTDAGGEWITDNSFAVPGDATSGFIGQLLAIRDEVTPPALSFSAIEVPGGQFAMASVKPPSPPKLAVVIGRNIEVH